MGRNFSRLTGAVHIFVENYFVMISLAIFFLG